MNIYCVIIRVSCTESYKEDYVGIKVFLFVFPLLQGLRSQPDPQGALVPFLLVTPWQVVWLEVWCWAQHTEQHRQEHQTMEHTIDEHAKEDLHVPVGRRKCQ